ncbi:MAG: hypothetical protein IJ043_10570 [Clostridia bacterium]|nr:hypothetical protein [Clostridia bacterium]
MNIIKNKVWIIVSAILLVLCVVLSVFSITLYKKSKEPYPPAVLEAVLTQIGAEDKDRFGVRWSNGGGIGRDGKLYINVYKYCENIDEIVAELKEKYGDYIHFEYAESLNWK